MLHESARKTFLNGFAQVMSTAALEALANGLRGKDPRINQGSTTTPPPLSCVQDWPVEAADPIAYAGWQGEKLETVGEVEHYFAERCFDADQKLGEPAACRWFLNWSDDTPRYQMFAELLGWVNEALEARKMAVVE